jgi:hypothetical protein
MSTPEKQFKYDSEYASKVVISLVKSPLYNQLETKNFDEELKACFLETRSLKLADYIQIPSHLNPGNYFLKQKQITINSSFFLCNQIV